MDPRRRLTWTLLDWDVCFDGCSRDARTLHKHEPAYGYRLLPTYSLSGFIWIDRNTQYKIAARPHSLLPLVNGDFGFTADPVPTIYPSIGEDKQSVIYVGPKDNSDRSGAREDHCSGFRSNTRAINWIPAIAS